MESKKFPKQHLCEIVKDIQHFSMMMVCDRCEWSRNKHFASERLYYTKRILLQTGLQGCTFQKTLSCKPNYKVVPHPTNFFLQTRLQGCTSQKTFSCKPNSKVVRHKKLSPANQSTKLYLQFVFSRKPDYKVVPLKKLCRANQITRLYFTTNFILQTNLQCCNSQNIFSCKPYYNVVHTKTLSLANQITKLYVSKHSSVNQRILSVTAESNAKHLFTILLLQGLQTVVDFGL